MSIPDERDPEELVTLSASVVLTSLPSDSARALDRYAHPEPVKLTIRFRSIGSAPILDQQLFKIRSDQRFSVVIRFLRRQLQLRPAESLFCYINSSFAPGLDELVGNLYASFAVDGQLVVAYCPTVAFG